MPYLFNSRLLSAVATSVGIVTITNSHLVGSCNNDSRVCNCAMNLSNLSPPLPLFALSSGEVDTVVEAPVAISAVLPSKFPLIISSYMLPDWESAPLLFDPVPPIPIAALSRIVFTLDRTSIKKVGNCNILRVWPVGAVSSTILSKHLLSISFLAPGVSEGGSR
jgi:hypothetical protein